MSPHCVECDVPQLARNHYFTGKLLVERDFSDEQRFFLGKERRHDRYLHGWGTVCGLKVVQHPTPACQSQYVLVQPGVAIDCCGREIVVPCVDTFDVRARVLAAWQAVHGTTSQPDTTPHRLQICIRYAECPAEQIPALFDGCGCDDTSCQPNRILERYQLDVILDAPVTPAMTTAPTLQWKFPLNLSNADRVAVDTTAGRLYVLKTDPTPSVVAFDATTYEL